MSENYIYSPSGEAAATGKMFGCRVPMKGSRQMFLVNGRLEEEGPGVRRSDNGAEIALGRGEEWPELLQVIAVRDESDSRDLAYETSVRMDESSRARLLFCSHTLSGHPFRTEERVGIRLERNAVLDLTVMQNEHDEAFHHTVFDIRLEKDAVLKLYLVTLHGGDISNRVEARLAGEGAACELSGLYLAGERQQMKTEIRLFHDVPHCKSSQLFKGILDGESVSRFNGLIYVAPDAQKTEAYQANHNLLISESAKIYTHPHLEIYADDVKCSHGATVGSLNGDELFYMRTRGIAEPEARLLQQMAFAYAVLEKISSEELRGRLQDLVERRLRGEFSRCGDCCRHCC